MAATIQRLETLPLDILQPLLVESRTQGFRFLDTLVDEYGNGGNRFDRPGELLLGVYEDNNLVAIGGLNRDPYLSDDTVGRVRHVYVLSERRGQGIGRLLVEKIISEARGRYQLLTLRTYDMPAAAFYEALGFVTQPVIENVSHHMILQLGSINLP